MRILDGTIDELIKQNKIKVKWSELECHGAEEFLNLVFQEQAEYGSISQAVIVENNVVCVILYDGIIYNKSEGLQTIIRMYIDTDDNILFLTRSGIIYIYEAESIDATDYKHYFGND